MSIRCRRRSSGCSVLAARRRGRTKSRTEGHEPLHDTCARSPNLHDPAFRRFRPEADWWKKKSSRARSTTSPRHHHKGEEHDLDDYEEEEKLHTQIRSGELGEMLQEAHLDHRIQMDFDDKNGEEAVGRS